MENVRSELGVPNDGVFVCILWNLDPKIKKKTLIKLLVMWLEEEVVVDHNWCDCSQSY